VFEKKKGPRVFFPLLAKSAELLRSWSGGALLLLTD
jgi:hypothetical protein